MPDVLSVGVQAPDPAVTGRGLLLQHVRNGRRMSADGHFIAAQAPSIQTRVEGEEVLVAPGHWY